MKKIALCISTDDYASLVNLKVSLSSFQKFNDDDVYVFNLSDSDKIKAELKDYDVTVIDYHYIEYEYSKKIYDKIHDEIHNMIFSNRDLQYALTMISILDYCNNNLNYDVMFKFDTDTVFINKVDFTNFYNSNKLLGGAKELNFKDFYTKEYNLNFANNFKDNEYINAGTIFLRKFKFNLLKEVITAFDQFNYKTPFIEQDCLNYIFYDQKFSDEQFLLLVNCSCSKDSITEPKNISCIHFCSKELKPLNYLDDNYNSPKWMNKDILDSALMHWNSQANDIGLNLSIKGIKNPKMIINKTNPKVMMCSFIMGNIEKYCNCAIVTMSSYKETNSLPVTWNIICEELDQDYIYSRLSFLEDDKIKFKFSRLSEIDLDTTRYNSFKWTSDYGANLFTRRIKWFDEHLNEADIIIAVDLDILFIDDAKDLILDFYNSPYMVGGQYEHFEIESGFRSHHLKFEKIFDFLRYVNFGFGMLNCNNLIGNGYTNNFERFVNISKGYEDYFNTQEQAYFSIGIPTKCIRNYPNTQTLIWTRHGHEEARFNVPAKMIHYASSDWLFDNNEDNLEQLKLKSGIPVRGTISILYIDKYVKMMNKCQNIDQTFVEKIKINQKLYKEYRMKNKLMIKVQMLRLGLYEY